MSVVREIPVTVSASAALAEGQAAAPGPLSGELEPRTWCQLRNDLRSFSVDGIRRIELVDAPAKEISLRMLDDYLLDSYGIVRGGEAQPLITQDLSRCPPSVRNDQTLRFKRRHGHGSFRNPRSAPLRNASHPLWLPISSVA
jgi:hypothetical protein